MKLDAPYYPIIYVRGFAASRSEIENTVATPYMGFNLGSTKIRQNYAGKPVKFVFESPLIRLMKDYAYSETYHHGDVIDSDYVNDLKASNEADKLKRSIWVFRYYEAVSEELGEGKRLRIPEFAKMLKAYIAQIRNLLCDTAKEKKEFKVYLVAHSMGGLVCRCYLQTLCKNSPSYVDKVFTYATPHNGIEYFGLNVPNLGFIDGMHTDNFNRTRMKKYLGITGPKQGANSLNGTFPSNKFFCFVGSNYKDYSAFHGLAQKGTGSFSDGLVMMKNAYVQNAPRAFAHRSHSGHYGIVNSEEGFQNLTRFLFGKLKVSVSLETKDITLPNAVYKELKKKSNKVDFKRLKASYYIETAAMIRQENYYMNERRVHQESAIRKEYDDLLKKPTRLFTGFLYGLKKTVDGRSSFAFQVAIKTPLYEIDNKFWLNSHFEGKDIFNETIIVSLNAGSDVPLTYKTSQMLEAEPLIEKPKGSGIYSIPIQPANIAANIAESKKPPESFWGALTLAVEPWNE